MFDSGNMYVCLFCNVALTERVSYFGHLHVEKLKPEDDQELQSLYGCTAMLPNRNIISIHNISVFE